MATDPSTNMTPDIYDLVNYVNTLKKEYNQEVSEDTLMVGMYGMIGELFSNIAQNTIVMASEFANESIPTKAKFEKNIISHALNLGIDTLNAIPAKMEAFITFIEDEIIDHIGGDYGQFIFDCNNKIYFGDFEFHPDYDIIIKRVKLNNGSYAYTAMYSMTGDGVFTNPISDITNPYLTPPVVVNVNGTRYLFLACTLRQVEKTTIYKKVLTDNTIASKTTNFEFSSQLAAFTVDVVNTSETVHLEPVYEGLSKKDSIYPYIWYTYLDSSIIRVKFDRNSYSPRLNSDICINLMTTQGEKGNFRWASKDYPVFSFESEKHNYSNLTVQVRPISNESLYGTDKKSIDELKRVIAVEALARGSVTNTTDLKNYFNAIDSENSEMYFYKKRDNALERLYYSYIVMKDAYSNIVPTNTVDIVIDPNMLEKETLTGKLILKRGKTFKLIDRSIIDEETGETDSYCVLSDVDPDNDPNNDFYYIIPYNFAICTDPLYGIYFLTTMNVSKNLEFVYINEDCQYQYISTYLSLNRKYLDESDTYKISIDVEQNLSDDNSMIILDPDTGEITGSKVKAFMVIYSDEGEPYRWVEAELTGYNGEAKIFNFTFSMTSQDFIDAENNIRIDGVNQIGNDSSTIQYGYFPNNCKAMIHIVTNQPEYSNNKIFNDLKGNKIDIANLIPDIGEDWCVSNSYNVINGIDFFYDYSEIVYSTIDVIQNDVNEDNTTGYMYRVSNVPLIKYNYFKNEDMVEYFFGELLRRKYYIDEALTYLEDSFGINFKFFNTYGPAHMFTLDNGTKYLNRINISIRFKLALQPNYDENIVQYIKDDIKTYVESISEINSLHMSNLVTQITDTYKESIIFFEFIDINGYGPGEQHIFAMQMPDNVVTPEIININTKDDQTPDIQIDIV